MYRAQGDEKMETTCGGLDPPLVKSHLHRSVFLRDAKLAELKQLEKE